MRQPSRNVRVDDVLWNVALHTAKEQGEPVANIVREALEAFVAEHAIGRLVRVDVDRKTVGVDPMTVRKDSSSADFSATAYTWSEPRQAYLRQPRTITLTAAQAKRVQTAKRAKTTKRAKQVQR